VPPPARATVPRILFVDDQPAFPHSIIRILPCHVDTLVVSSALKAIRELEKFPYDLVVTDLVMQGLSGTDLLILVKERWPEVRRILLTAHTSAHLLGRAYPYSDSILDKIVDSEILCETICRLADEPRK
jgi:DNA-binding NarL/FixJ family response regulator